MATTTGDKTPFADKFINTGVRIKYPAIRAEPAIVRFTDGRTSESKKRPNNTMKTALIVCLIALAVGVQVSN